jgi:hypothetical protein
MEPLLLWIDGLRIYNWKGCQFLLQYIGMYEGYVSHKIYDTSANFYFLRISPKVAYLNAFHCLKKYSASKQLPTLTLAAG